MFDGGKARLRLFFVAYSRVQSSPPVEEYPKGEVVFRISRLFIKDHPSGCYPAPLRRRRTLFSGITNRGGIGCGVNAQLKWDSGIIPECRHPAAARDPVFANAKTCVADIYVFHCFTMKNLLRSKSSLRSAWVPAFAGMTILWNY